MQIINPETSVRHSHYTLRNNPDHRKSHLLRCPSFESCSSDRCFCNANIRIHVLAIRRLQWKLVQIWSWVTDILFFFLIWANFNTRFLHSSVIQEHNYRTAEEMSVRLIYRCISKCLLAMMQISTLTFKTLPVTWCTNNLTFNNFTFCPHCIYAFCIYLRTNSDLSHLQHKLIGFYNRDEKFLLRGTNWLLNKAVCCIYLRTKSDLCHLQHKLIGFYNWDEKCLPRGTNWVFK